MDQTVSHFHPMRLPVLEDAKALLILLQVIYHGGEIESRELRRKIVEVLDAMTRSTFWRKLDFLEREGFLGREARMKRNKAVAYIVVVEPSIKFIRFWGPGPIARLLGDWVKRTINPQIPAAEEETDQQRESLAIALEEIEAGRHE